MKSPKSPQIILDRNNPGKSAELFIKHRRPHLIRQQREWLVYDGRVYVVIEDDTIRADVRSFLDEAIETKTQVVGGSANTTTAPYKPKLRDVTEVYDALVAKTHIPREKMSPPCWLDGRKGDPREIICVENGLLNITTRELMEHTPAYFTRTLIPLCYDPFAPEPRLWFKFLREVFAGREELIALLQEAIGYKLSADMKHHKVFFYIGLSRAGKGTVLRIERALIGPTNIANPNLEDLAGRFWAEDLIGKSNLVVTDANCSNKSVIETAGNRLNAISGEDAVDAQRKGRTNWNGTLAARATIVANKYLDFGKHADAMLNRAIVFSFEVSFAGREDHALTEKLCTELAGILNWALDGYDRVRANGFTEPDIAKQSKSRMKYLADPVHGFTEDKCVIDPEACVDKDVLYGLFHAHVVDEGLRPMDKPNFTERLREIHPHIKPSKRRTNDRQIPVYRGIRIADDELSRVYRMDRDRLALGFTPFEALLTDADGAPVPLNVSEFD